MASFMIAFGFLIRLIFAADVSASSYLRLQHKYTELAGSSKHGPMTTDHFEYLRSHDVLRHRRHLLGATAFPLGGSADPTTAGLYFTELQIGTPASLYYAQVDTGSDVLWLGCASCRNCPSRSNLGVKLRPYDPSDSKTSAELSCTENLCTTRCVDGNLCLYQLAYGDGSTSEGYLVKDILELPSLQNFSASADSATITFGLVHKDYIDVVELPLSFSK
ncbi:hypothetical protein L7F22_061469 [Adiantum nelumboides]|nr:hypothetical protein [Adiantum nelumboides]